MDQRQLLEACDRYQAEARSLLGSKCNPTRARFCLLKAADFLRQAADNTSDSTLANLRREQAEQLLSFASKVAEQSKDWQDNGADESVGMSDTNGFAAPKENSHGFSCTERPNLRFEDIAGLAELKSTLRRRVLDPLQHPDLAQQYGINPGVGLLLYGPPGTGKTMLAQALAGEVGAPFYVIKPSDILVRYVGDSEQRLQTLFSEARSHPLSVIFIDEIEALAPSRERANDSSGVMGRLVPQILQELDGAGSRGSNPILLVGATNEPWSLDPALLRPGRFDLRVLVDLPDQAALAELLQIHLRDIPQAYINCQQEAQRMDGWSGADVKALIEAARIIPFSEAVAGGTPRPLSSGDLAIAARRITPSVNQQRRQRFHDWGRQTSDAKAQQVPPPSEAPVSPESTTRSDFPLPAPSKIEPADNAIDLTPGQSADSPAKSLPVTEQEPAITASPWNWEATGPWAKQAPIHHARIRDLLAELAEAHALPDEMPQPDRTRLCAALREEGLEVPADNEVLLHAGAATLRYSLPGASAPKASTVEALRERLLTAHAIRLISVQPGPGALHIAVGRDPRAIPSWPYLALQDMDRGVDTPLIGPDEDGGPAVCLDLSGSDPHCLIAGSTGGGKSVLMRSLVMDLALRGNLNQLRLILIDPKQLDLSIFQSLPHLLQPAITEPQDALTCFTALVGEMERRYRMLAAAGVTNLSDYQSLPDQPPLPRIVVCCDEFANWMLDDDFKTSASNAIFRLGAKARAAGIHLILATQRPEARVVPTLLRANLSGRICLRVATGRESELVIDRPGGERLLGQGHALAVLAGTVRPVQVPWFPPAELKQLVNQLNVTTTESAI